MPSARQRSRARPVASWWIGEAGVDAAAFEEQPADRRARALRGDQDHVDVLRRHDAGLVAEDDREAVREVQRLARRSGAA